MGVILNQHGRAYTAAAHNRLTQHLPSIHRPTADELEFGTLTTLRSRSRFIFNNHAHANGAIRLIARRVAGAGLRIQARLRGADRRFMRAENEALEALWRDRNRMGLSTRGHKAHKFWRLAVTTYLVDGEVFLIRAENPAREGVTSEWQMLGGDMVAENLDPKALKGVAAGNTVRLGVEMTPQGRPVAYHFFADGHSVYWDGGNRETVRVPAERVIHWYHDSYGDAPRGVPILTPVILKLADLDEFFSATLTQAWAQANVVAFVKSGFGSERMEALPKRVGATGQDDQQNPTRWTEEMVPGVKEYLLPGEDVTFANPHAPSDQVDPFSKVILRAIAAGVGVSYEALARDYTQTNYSSGRQTENEDKLTFAEINLEMDQEVVEPIWRDHVDHVYTINRLREKAAVVDVADLYAHYVQHPVKDHADPLKEVKADLEAIAGRVESRQAVCAKRGRDFFDVAQELAEEEQFLAEIGVSAAAMDGKMIEVAEDDSDDDEDGNGTRKDIA